MDFETEVKTAVYRMVAASGEMPDAAAVAAALGVPEGRVVDAFAALAGRRLLVLEPGDPARIRMASPFSGVETAFRVLSGGVSYWANCSWDALGVAAALGRDAVVEAADGHSGEPIELEVRDGRPLPVPCVAHFAVPAARWWDDIIHT